MDKSHGKQAGYYMRAVQALCFAAENKEEPAVCKLLLIDMVMVPQVLELLPQHQ